MSQQGPLHPAVLFEFAEILLGLQVYIDPIYKSLSAEHPAWERDHDTRLAVFSGIHAVVEQVRTMLNLYRGVFLPSVQENPSMLNQAFGTSRPNKLLLDYEHTMLFVLFHGVFHQIETGLRSILRAVAPGVCDDGRAAFESIYTALFRTQMKIAPVEGVELLSLCRNIRNTIHNNGVVHNKAGVDISVTYKNVVYEFKHRSVIEIAWELLFVLIKDLIDLLNTIVRDPNIAGYAGTIPDEAWDYVRPDQSPRTLSVLSLVPDEAGLEVVRTLFQTGHAESLSFLQRKS
jgi:hypothetical protein